VTRDRHLERPFGECDLVDLARRFDRLGTGDAVAIPATYSEAIATVR